MRTPSLVDPPTYPLYLPPGNTGMLQSRGLRSGRLQTSDLPLPSPDVSPGPIKRAWGSTASEIPLFSAEHSIPFSASFSPTIFSTFFFISSTHSSARLSSSVPELQVLTRQPSCHTPPGAFGSLHGFTAETMVP